MADKQEKEPEEKEPAKDPEDQPDNEAEPEEDNSELPKQSLDVPAGDRPSYVYPKQNFSDYQYDVDKIGATLYGDTFRMGELYAQQKANELQALRYSLIPPEPEDIIKDTDHEVALDDFFKKISDSADDVDAVDEPQSTSYSPPKSTFSLEFEPPYYSNIMSNQHQDNVEYEPDKVTRTVVYPKYTQKPNLKNEESKLEAHPSSKKIKIVIIIVILLLFIVFLILIAWIFKSYFIDVLGKNKISQQ